MLYNLHPQDRALIIGKYGCLAMCYMFCLGIPLDVMNYIRILSDAIDSGVGASGIASDCTVMNPDRFAMWLCNKKVRVEKKVCYSIRNIKNPTPINYIYTDASNTKHNHFVVVENGEIVFNPIEYSQCVIRGKPESMRVINFL